jgi:hypothetical protein
MRRFFEAKRITTTSHLIKEIVNMCPATFIQNLNFKTKRRSSFCHYLRLIALLVFVSTSTAQAQSSLPEQHLQASLENQKAQAAYYQAQRSDNGTWQTIVSALPGVLGALVGALAAIGGSVFTSNRQASLEKDKWQRAKEDEWEKETRLALAELTKNLAAAVHAIAWCTWCAASEPEEMHVGHFSRYDRESKGLFPVIVGARVVLATLDHELHEKMTPLIKKLYRLDEELSHAAALFRKEREQGLEKLAICYKESSQFDKEILQTVSNIANLREV